MKNNTVYDRIRARIKPETQRYVRLNLAIAMRVADILQTNGWTQKDLAQKMGKAESEISKWLSGSHNLTLKSISKMETVLGVDVLAIAQQEEIRATTLLIECESAADISERQG